MAALFILILDVAIAMLIANSYLLQHHGWSKTCQAMPMNPHLAYL